MKDARKQAVLAAILLALLMSSLLVLSCLFGPGMDPSDVVPVPLRDPTWDSEEARDRVRELVTIQENHERGGYSTEIIDHLARLGRPAIPELGRLLYDHRDSVVLAVSYALADMQGEEDLAAPLLLRKLAVDDERIVLPALLTLSRRPAGAAAIRRDVRPLHDVLRRGPLGEMPMAMRVLGYSGDETCIPLLRIRAKRPAYAAGNSFFYDFGVKGYAHDAMLTLARLGDRQTLDLLKDEISRDNAWTRYKVLLELGYVARKELVRAVIPLLEDPRYPTGSENPRIMDELYDERIRDMAACVLAMLVSEEFFRLPDCHRDHDFPFRRADAEDVRKWKEWWERHKDDPEYR